MMQEKAMVSDALNSINASLKTYTDYISQSENPQLRSALQQMRNEAEKSQYELYNMAKSKNYYQPAKQASKDEINSIKSTFTGSDMSGGMTGGTSGMTGGSSGMAGGSSGMSSGSSGMTGGSSGMTGGSSGMSSGSSGMTGGASGMTNKSSDK